MKINPTYTKAELLNRLTFRCEHRHSGLSHPRCYDKKFKYTEKIGFFDIEASNLSADFGYMISYCIKKEGGAIIARAVTPREIRKGTTDWRLCQQFVKDSEQFDRLIGHYSCRFDLPFVRTRCIIQGVEYPVYGSLMQKDTWRVARDKFKFHSNRLEAIANALHIPAKGHKLDPERWQQAQAGNQKAIDFIVKHNKEDVIATEMIWHKIRDSIKLTNTSI